MDKQYKEWLQEQTFETLAADNYNTKLLLLAEQAKNKKLVDMITELLSEQYIAEVVDEGGGTIREFFYSDDEVICKLKQALNEVNNASI